MDRHNDEMDEVFEEIMTRSRPFTREELAMLIETDPGRWARFSDRLEALGQSPGVNQRGLARGGRVRCRPTDLGAGGRPPR